MATESLRETTPGSGSRQWTRAVLAAGVVAGIAYAVSLPQFRPDQVGIASDVYYHAGRALLSGGDLYGVTPPDHPTFRFLYPPIVILAFLPHALLGDPALAFALQVPVNLAAAVGIGRLSVRAVESAGHRLERADRLLVYGFALASTLSAVNVLLGQVTLPLTLGIAGGAVLLERDRPLPSGVAFGLVALVKLFPALFGAWLVRRRAWRAVGAATAAGVLGLLVGVVVFGPDLTVTYLTEVIPGEASTGVSAGRYDPTAEVLTVRRQIAFLAPWLDPAWRFPVGVAVLAPVVLAAWRTAADPLGRLVALEATILGTLLAFPLEPYYLGLALFPTLPLAYLVEGRWARRLFLAGIAVTSAVVTFATVEQTLLLVGASGPAREAVLAVVRPAFSFVQPTSVGVWLLLGGCVLAQYRLASGAGSPGGGDGKGEESGA